MTEAKSLSYTNEGWVLSERYISIHADAFYLVFKRADQVHRVEVSKEVWHSFDGLKIVEKVSLTV